ncbi:MAG: SAM-dependent methyltransferase [Nocardiopsaceae bacterium]|nr:SAM-dependent methyltransferase [Nocardiopsaceae bacterium]
MSDNSPQLDTGVPHSARVWNYWLGGKDNYAVDREVGEQLRAILPDGIVSARADREFLARSVRFLVAEQGIRQFLDVGTGLPTANNTHEVAQRVAPECRIVYVDNDPLVLVHARALLVGAPEGATDYIHEDARNPEAILHAAEATLDFDRPVAIILSSILNYIVDDDEAQQVVDTLLAAVPSGSYLAVGHPASDVDPEGMAELLRVWNQANPNPMTARSRSEVARFFTGLEMVEPGVVSAPAWRPDAETLYVGREVPHLVAVGRKP